jgi:hypothetical protein
MKHNRGPILCDTQFNFYPPFGDALLFPIICSVASDVNYGIRNKNRFLTNIQNVSFTLKNVKVVRSKQLKQELYDAKKELK